MVEDKIGKDYQIKPSVRRRKSTEKRLDVLAPDISLHLHARLFLFVCICVDVIADVIHKGSIRIVRDNDLSSVQSRT